MSLEPPFIAIPLRPHISEGLATLTQRSRTCLTDADKKIGVQLLADAYCDILDHCLVELLHDINRTHPSRYLKEAEWVANEIKEKIQHYLGWIVSFFSSERLIPVIAHFNALVHGLTLQGQTQRAYTAFAISPRLATDSIRVLASLQDGTARNLEEGTELLIQTIEEALQPLMIQPKQLMKFNFAVNKTLDGVIMLLLSLFKRMLHKSAPQISRELYPRLATHLSRFLIVSTP